MASAIEDSELLVVPGGTHVVPLEAPERVNSAVGGFLRKTFTRV